ncbi:MAG: rhodanese-like domain-containing protein [Gammaproteobacteria bacterium]|nr:rhodanese-like domain-containing protein [Gammaproteobacteria bacterium]
MSRIMTLVIFISYLFSSAALAADKEFPGRDIYLGTPYIELAAFHQQFKYFIVVDVRSHYEYETLRILGAINIPLNSSGFIPKMQQLRDNNKAKKIIVYCNGKTCMKSYQAASKAKARGIEGVIVFDAGIMDWARAYPALAELLGKSPVDASKLISKARFDEHLLAPDKFADMTQAADVRVLDVRDSVQRSGMGLFVGIEHQAPLDDKEKLEKHIQTALDENKTLLIYDESGKQVRWLMYWLEEKGLKKYLFMEGGARLYFKQLKARLKR